MMQLILLLLLALFGVVYCEKWQIDRLPHYTFSYGKYCNLHGMTFKVRRAA